MAEQLERGEATLEYRDGVGYLPRLLDATKSNLPDYWKQP